MRFLFFKAGSAKYRFLLVFFSGMQGSRNIILVQRSIALKAMQRTRFQTFEHRLRSRRRLIGEFSTEGQ
jgi:hypothetical protein